MVDLRKTAADILYNQLQNDEIACCRDEDPECHYTDYIDDHYHRFQESAVKAMIEFALHYAMNTSK